MTRPQEPPPAPPAPSVAVAARRRSRIGIITGSGPEAGVDLWRKILAANRRRFGTTFRGDLDAPEVVIFSVPDLGLSMALQQNDARVWSSLSDTATRIAPHVDWYGIACNTLNHYADRLAGLRLPATLVSMVDVVRDHLAGHGLTRAALLGAQPVMDMGAWSAYRTLPMHADVELPDDPAALHRIIEDVKRQGGDRPDLVARFEAVLAGLSSDVVLLACTELPLIPVRGARQRLVDVTELLAQALVDRSLAPPPARTQGGTALASDVDAGADVVEQSGERA